MTVTEYGMPCDTYTATCVSWAYIGGAALLVLAAGAATIASDGLAAPALSSAIGSGGEVLGAALGTL